MPSTSEDSRVAIRAATGIRLHRRALWRILHPTLVRPLNHVRRTVGDDACGGDVPILDGIAALASLHPLMERLKGSRPHAGALLTVPVGARGSERRPPP